MFLRRNVASQQFTVPGSLVLKADGDAVTTGAAIYLNGSGTAGGGTLTHWRNGVWRYTPTQAETDVTIVEYTLEATDAISLAGSIRTTNADPNKKWPQYGDSARYTNDTTSESEDVTITEPV